MGSNARRCCGAVSIALIERTGGRVHFLSRIVVNLEVIHMSEKSFRGNNPAQALMDPCLRT